MATKKEIAANRIIQAKLENILDELSLEIRSNNQRKILFASALMTAAQEVLIEVHGPLVTSELLYSAADSVATMRTLEMLDKMIDDEGGMEI